MLIWSRKFLLIVNFCSQKDLGELKDSDEVKKKKTSNAEVQNSLVQEVFNEV